MDKGSRGASLSIYTQTVIECPPPPGSWLMAILSWMSNMDLKVRQLTNYTVRPGNYDTGKK